MLVLVWLPAIVAAAIHILIFCMESLWWTSAPVRRRFRQSPEQADATRLFAFNQGFYNLFLAIGVLAGLTLTSLGHRQIGLTLGVFSSLSMTGAALALVASAPHMRRGALIQGVPPLLFLLLAAGRSAQTPVMLRADEMTWEACSTAIPHGPRCAALEGDRTVADAPFTYRLRLPDGYRVPPHVHPMDGHLTVIAGTLNIGWGDTFDVKATRAMPAGSFIVIPRGARHYYWAQGETIVQSHGIGPWGVTYVNPADDPRRK